MNIQNHTVGFKYKQLWEGCVLASIAHAIMVSHFPEISHEHSWDGINYSVQDSSGTRGTITFHPKYCIGAFRNESSSRMHTGDRTANDFFIGATGEIIHLAETEALQYLLENVQEEMVPVITTAFWGTTNELKTTDSQQDMLENGVFLLNRQVMDFGKSIEAWREYYEMEETHVILLKSIYSRMVSNQKQKIVLSAQDREMIGSPDQEGIRASRESFEEIGVIWS